MVGMNVNDAQCEALFASTLQRSDAPTFEAVASAIGATLSRLGPDGCACRMAQEFGDHPEAAHDRMQWARRLVGELSDASARLAAQPGEVLA
jgi:hypothetical protein